MVKCFDEKNISVVAKCCNEETSFQHPLVALCDVVLLLPCGVCSCGDVTGGPFTEVQPGCS